MLSRAEADIAAAIEALNNQMNAALAKLTELASTQCGRGQVVVRTAPLDRATATFQRLVAEVVEDQQAEMLPPLIALRNELAQRAGGDGDANPVQGDDFHQRGLETLDHVLQLAGVQLFTPRIGEPFDPLIHLAVGEARREDLEQGSVAETLQPGFRSTRGKILAAARILVNRR
ncbi:MAG: nucleotide exchange factor GrpE [Phycisphaerae bacterium]|nr:nucleotide exchange factor GrpE [Phycisphaerae bacterium]